MFVLYFSVLLLSFVGIYWSANTMLNGAIGAARQYSIPLTVIGVVVIGFGTSAPEILVSVLGAVSGSSEIALGNLLGSNFTNLALVLGLTAVLSTVVFNKTMVQYYFISIAAMAIVGLFLWLKTSLTFSDGLIMLTALALALLVMVRIAGRSAEALENETGGLKKNRRSLIKLFGGLAVLLAVSEATVWSAIKISAMLGISELIIGLTIVAIGTSLPELVVSLLSAIRRRHSIAVGNLIGSNIFNSIGGVGFSAMFAPLAVPPLILTRDFAVVFGVSLLLGLLLLLPRFMHVGPWKGSLLLLCFVAYLWLLYSSVVY